jgi:hypothetical protein
MDCKIIRRKLVTLGTLTLGSGEYNEKGQEWRTEACGTPIFGDGQKEVCSSCLNGWTHENNYMLDTEENKNLLEKALLSGPPIYETIVGVKEVTEITQILEEKSVRFENMSNRIKTILSRKK